MSGRRAKRAKPVVHRRDHEHGGVDPVRIVYEDVGDSGSTGLAVLFDTYPQTADYLIFDVETGIAMTNHDDSPVSISQQGDEVLVIENTGTGQINIESSGTGGIVIQCSSSADIIVTVSGGNLILDGLPTSPPAAAGGVWNDGGTLKIT